MKGSFLFLGTGASTGTPIVGCSCKVCTSSCVYNRRLRPSGLISINGRRILIDCGPDFRQQALCYGIDHLDALLVTHTHYDHIGGIDELRVFFMRHRDCLPCFLSTQSHEEIRRRYDYLFDRDTSYLRPRLQFHLLSEDRGWFKVAGTRVDYFSFQQGQTGVLGFRLGDFAYITDIRYYDDSIFEPLKGVGTLVISAISSEGSRAHFSIAEAIAFGKRCQCQQIWLTHVGHEIDHEAMRFEKGQGIAYDGFEFEFNI
jgi:phosphoribosyl 1,2-cyclic phosphate phosphodiesterase